MMENAPQPRCVECGGLLQPLSRCASCGSAYQVKGYRVEKTLAQHPHSRVYVARSPDGRPVALKELLFAVVPSAQQLDAFYREAAVLQALQLRRTPHFIEAFSVGEGVDTRLYLAQEFIEGESLLARLGREPLRGAAFDDVATQVLETLIVLHSRTPRLIHRDIKPENLVFRANGELVLVDFGSARQLEQAVTFGSTLVGTVGYMPPEQLGGTVDESSDLHALGASLLHAATAKAPSAFLLDGMHLQFRPVAALTPQQNEFLARLTAPKKADRFSTAEAALRWLRAPHRRPRRKLVLALGALAVFLGGLVVASTAVRRNFVAVDQEHRPTAKALVDEARSGMRGLLVAERAFFAEFGRYSHDAVTTGFVPDVWCPDGARVHHVENPLPGEAVGCHFLYGVILEGAASEPGATVYARGAVEPVLGKAWVTALQGARAGIPEEWTSNRLSPLLGDHSR